MAKKTPEAPAGRRIVFLSSEHPPEIHRLGPSQSSVSTSAATSPVCDYNRPSTSSSSIQSMPSQQREPMHRRSYSFPPILPDWASDWQPAASPYCSSETGPRTPTMVDMGRLKCIYKQHANDFWSTIAEKYSDGPSLDPSELEHAFFRGQSGEESSPEIPRIIVSPRFTSDTFLKVPEMSPDVRHARRSSHTRSSSAASSIAGRCSVEALLNHGTT